MIELDVLRLVVLAAVIGYAAYSDHRTGEVPNKVWVYAPAGFFLTVISLVLSPELLYLTLVSFAATVIFSFVLFYIGGWGGGDTKAFLTIGVSFPLALFSVFNVMFIYPLSVALIASLIAFAAGQLKKTKEVRFLPYVFISLFIALLF